MTEIQFSLIGLYYAPLQPALIIFDNSSVCFLLIDIGQHIVYQNLSNRTILSIKFKAIFVQINNFDKKLKQNIYISV